MRAPGLRLGELDVAALLWEERIRRVVQRELQEAEHRRER